MRKLLTFSFILLFTTSCVSTQEWLASKSQDFQLGYKNGCQNGEDMASYSYIFKSNETDKMYKGSEEYRIGWDDGYETCFSDKELDNMMRSRRF